MRSSSLPALLPDAYLTPQEGRQIKQQREQSTTLCQTLVEGTVVTCYNEWLDPVVLPGEKLWQYLETSGKAIDAISVLPTDDGDRAIYFYSLVSTDQGYLVELMPFSVLVHSSEPEVFLGASCRCHQLQASANLH